MKDTKLHHNIAAVLLGISILSVTAIAGSDTAYAAVQKQEASVKQEGIYKPNLFTEKIKRILAEYNQKNVSTKEPEHKSSASSAENTAGTEKADQAGEQKEKSREKIQLPQPYNEQHNFRNEGRYNFDWQGTPIAQSLYAVAKVANRDVVVNGTLDGKVYMSLHNVTCEKAMQYLSNAFNFNWMVDDNAILVSTSDTMLQSKIIPVHHLSDMEKVTNELKALGLDESNIFANSETRSVSVTGTPYQVAAAVRHMSAIDKPVSQCLVLAQLIEINHGDKLDLGMQYSLPTYSHTGTTSGITDSSSFKGNWLEKLTFSANATASKSLSKGKVVSRPMIMVMNGQEGVVNFGDQVPILSSTTTSSSTSVTAEYKDIGTNLTITPAIDEVTGTISMKIAAEISNITSWISKGETTAPQISTRKATTSAHLKSGQSFVIGGLMSVKDLDNLSGIPGLMNLPILGELFKFHSQTKEYSEVYIMITPYIVTDDIDPKEILRQVGD